MSFEWTAERRERVRVLYEIPMSHGQIARAVSAEWREDITKNAIVGQVHRMGLPPRPSPIVKRGPTKMTDATKRLLTFLIQSAHAGRPAPTNDEVLAVLRAESSSTAVRALKDLERLGHIRVEQTSANARAIMAADGSWRMDSAQRARPHRAERAIAPQQQQRQPAPEVQEHVAAQRVAHLRAQIAAVTGRTGTTTHKRCQFPMWPDTARPTPPGPLDTPTLGPSLYCGEPVALGFCCVRHAAVCYRERPERAA